MREALFRVQDLDLSIDEIRRNIRDEKAAYAAREKACILAAERLEELKAELKKIKIRSGGLESEVASFQSKFDQLDGRRRAVTNVKQLQAMESEAEKLGTEIGTREEALMAVYEELEAAQKGIADQEERLARLKRELVEARGQAREKVARLKEEGKARTTEREASLQELDEALVAEYDRLRSTHGGRVAFLIEEARCPACSDEIPFFHYNKLSHNRERFFPCESCGRLLTYDGP